MHNESLLIKEEIFQQELDKTLKIIEDLFINLKRIFFEKIEEEKEKFFISMSKEKEKNVKENFVKPLGDECKLCKLF